MLKRAKGDRNGIGGLRLPVVELSGVVSRPKSAVQGPRPWYFLWRLPKKGWNGAQGSVEDQWWNIQSPGRGTEPSEANLPRAGRRQPCKHKLHDPSEILHHRPKGEFHLHDQTRSQSLRRRSCIEAQSASFKGQERPYLGKSFCHNVP